MDDKQYGIIDKENADRIVQDTAQWMIKLMAFSTKGVDRKQSWLLMGRTLNLVFSQYYGIALSDMDKELNKTDEEILEIIRKEKIRTVKL